MGGTPSAPRLVQQLANDRPSVRQAAVREICSLAAIPEKRRHVAIAGCVPPLIALLAAGDPQIVENAAAALSHLAMHPENKVEIAAAGGVGAIVDFLRGLQQDPLATPGAKGAAAAALANLSSRCTANQTEAADAGAIPVLSELLHDNAPQARIWAAAALGNLASQHGENQDRIGKAGAAPALVDLAKASAETAAITADAHSQASMAEGVLTCRRRAPPAMPGPAQRQGLKLQPEQQRWVVRALSSTAFNHEGNQQRIADAGGIDALVGLIKSGSAAMQCEAVRALCYVMGNNPECKKRLAEAPGGVAVVAALVTSAKVGHEERGLAAMLLGSLARGGHEAAVVEGGGAAALAQLAAAPGPQAALGRERAAQALFHLAGAESEDVKKRLIEAGAVRPLVHLALGHGASAKAVVHAAQALGLLADSNEDNRRHVEEAGGASVLRQLNAMVSDAVRGVLPDEEELFRLPAGPTPDGAAAAAAGEAAASLPPGDLPPGGVDVAPGTGVLPRALEPPRPTLGSAEQGDRSPQPHGALPPEEVSGGLPPDAAGADGSVV